MDMTGLQAFSEALEQFHKRGVTIYLCEANANVTKKLMRVGITRWLEQQHIFNSLIDVVKSFK